MGAHPMIALLRGSSLISAFIYVEIFYISENFAYQAIVTHAFVL